MTRIVWVLAALAPLGLASCGTKSDSGPSEGAQIIVKQAPQDRGYGAERNAEFEQKWDDFYNAPHDAGDTLIVGEIGDADSLNELTSGARNAQTIIELLFLKLARMNPDFSHAPSLAESWEFSEDHRELTFHLRDDVYWHDGVKVTAHDVAFTSAKQRNENIGWANIKTQQFVVDCVALDDRTVKYVFERTYPYQLMDVTDAVVLPKHKLEHLADEEWKTCDFNRNPVGSGPFKFKSWKAQQSIELVANEDFYAGRPPLDRIIFKVVPDQESLVLQMKSGQIDLWEGVNPRFFDELAREPELAAHVYPSRAYTYLGWNLKEPLFASKKVRQALTMAINRQEIVEALFKQYGEVCNGPIVPILWAYNPNVPSFDYDPEKAKRFLADEGWTDTDGDGWLDRDGRRFTFELKTNKGNKDREDITVMIQDMLKEVGIDVRPNVMEWTVLLDDLNKKRFEAVVMGWSVDLKIDMSIIWHSKSVGDKFNFVSYTNPQLDTLNDAALFEMDREKAKTMWWQAQEIIAEDQPYTFLYVPKRITFVHNRFQNVQIETVGWHYNVEQWWVPKERQKY